MESAYVGGSGAAGLRFLAAQLGRVPPELQKQLRPAVKSAGQQVLREAAVNASWSSRIPRALKIRVSFGARSAGAYVYAATSLAPHARAYEGITGRRDFRHPVFGGETWVSQSTRPFLLPALQASAATVLRDVEEAIDTVARGAGFR